MVRKAATRLNPYSCICVFPRVQHLVNRLQSRSFITLPSQFQVSIEQLLHMSNPTTNRGLRYLQAVPWIDVRSYAHCPALSTLSETIRDATTCTHRYSSAYEGTVRTPGRYVGVCQSAYQISGIVSFRQFRPKTNQPSNQGRLCGNPSNFRPTDRRYRLHA